MDDSLTVVLLWISAGKLLDVVVLEDGVSRSVRLNLFVVSKFLCSCSV